MHRVPGVVLGHVRVAFAAAIVVALLTVGCGAAGAVERATGGNPVTALFAPTIAAPLGVVAQAGVPLVAINPLTGKPVAPPPPLLRRIFPRLSWLTCGRTCRPVRGAATALFIPRCDATRCDVGKRIRVRLGKLVSAPTPQVTASENIPGRACVPSTCAAADANLLSRYKPTLVLTSSESWAPSAVEDAIGDYRLRRIGSNEASPVRLGDLPVTPGRGKAWRLDNVRCDTRLGEECYGRRLRPLAPDARPAYVLYGRVWKVPTGRSHTAYGDVAYALQYWLFYYFDAFPNNQRFFITPTAWQLHESDWEFVEVLVNSKLDGRVAAYSKHCAGSVRPWQAVDAPHGHPVVYVARGSHANYFAPTSGTPARALCSSGGLPFNLASLDKGFFDVANGDSSPLPRGSVKAPPDELVNVTRAPRWFFFDGKWGQGNYLRFRLPGGRWKAVSIPGGDAPGSPGNKKEWTDPLRVLRWPVDR